MKKRNLIPCLMLTLFLIPAASQADTAGFRMDPAAEPDGFLGIKWGDDLSRVPGMIKIGTSGASDVYRRQEESATVGLVAKIREVRYSAYDSKFYAVKILLEPGEENLQALQAAITARYGPGFDAGGGNYLMVGNDAGLHLRFPEASQGGWDLAIFSRPLAREADEAARRLKDAPRE